MSHDDFAFEPVRGLPEALPEGERILWQGSPDPWRLACEALKLRWIAGYFAVLTVWRVGVSSTAVPLGEALLHGVPFVLAGLVACGLVYVVAFVQARAAVYTLTNRRVAMRIGAALTLTLNLPYTQIANASLERRRGGSGTLAFELTGDPTISYFMSWPHVRPWHLARCQPALRCVANADVAARIFADAAEARVNEPVIERVPAHALAAE